MGTWLSKRIDIMINIWNTQQINSVKTQIRNERDFSKLNYMIFGLIFLIVFGAVALGVEQYKISISNTSEIKITPPLMVMTGKSSETSTQITSIDWGSLYPDTSKTYTFWLYNDHPQDNITIYMSTIEWSPKEAENYIKLEWNYEGYKLAPKTSILVTFTLTVSPDIINITKFNFNIVITGTLISGGK
jgi:hypothetical protein